MLSVPLRGAPVFENVPVEEDVVGVEVVELTSVVVDVTDEGGV